MRSFEVCLAELHERPRYSKKLNLDRIRALMAALGNPQERLRFVHVAGTNGKGSICAMTAAVLQEAGNCVGLFTSPYLKVFEERIRVNGMNIPQPEFARLYERVYAVQCGLEAAGGEPANEFEVTTAVAVLWFEEQRCDYVVLEVGLGGRLDATNVIPPQQVCCIAHIDLDHTAQLGNTIASVAGEKAGIIKPGSVVVTPAAQNPEALAVFAEACAERGATLRVTQQPEEIRTLPERTEFTYGGERFATALAGSHQASNAACAVEICRELGFSDAQIRAGLLAVRWPGRLELLNRQPEIVLDCGHNPDGIRSVLRSLREVYPNRRCHVMMAMMQDKDYRTSVHAMTAQAERFYATTVDMPRALSAEALCAVAAEVCTDCCAEPTPRAALQRAMSELGEGDLLVICGSVYLAGEILRISDETRLFDRI